MQAAIDKYTSIDMPQSTMDLNFRRSPDLRHVAMRRTGEAIKDRVAFLNAFLNSAPPVAALWFPTNSNSGSAASRWPN